MEEEFRVFFVKPHHNEENGSLLVKAFEELVKGEYNFRSEWISEDDCLKAAGKGKQIYIFDSFEGSAFEHIKELGYRVYGPLCILGNLLHGLELPKNKKRPIMNLAMKGIKVCCTSVDRPIRDEISRKVHLMCGEVELNLTADVTHLIAGEVGSHKYLVALQNKKAVMTKEWVDAVWQASQDKNISALSDEIYEKYVCPPFLGLTVCVSGFSSSERNKMRNFVVRGGGKYSGELKMNECTHLVVKEPKGAKYEAAKNWKIRIVQDRWLYESMDKQKYIDPKPYQYNTLPQDKGVKTSTPERKSVSGPNINDISAISCGANISLRPVDETRDMTSTRMSEQFYQDGHNLISESRMGTTTLDADASKSSVDIVLDGCKIFLSGVKPVTEEKLRKIISATGAFKASSIDATITHVVIGDVITSDVLQLSKLKKCPHVVSVDWIMDSFSNNMHLSEAKYERADLGLVTPSMRKEEERKAGAGIPKPKASVSGQDASGSTSEKEHAPNSKATDSVEFGADAPSDLEMVELLSQYNGPQDETVENNAAQGEEKLSQNQTLVPADDNELDGMTQDPNEVSTQDPAGDEEQGIFSGRKFIILGFEEEEQTQLQSFITERGGKMAGNTKKRQVADIAVVPLLGYPVEVTVSEVLTNAWLQLCIEEEEFLPYDNCWLAKPFDVPEEQILAGCHISVSGFTGVERECITHLCQSMGAKCQEHFARRTNKNVTASTHLILNSPTGKKYDAAKNWGIPAIGKEWIFECVKSGKRVSESEFDIDLLEQRQQEVEEVAKLATSANVSAASNSDLPTPNKPSNKSNADKDLSDEKEVLNVDNKEPKLLASFHTPRQMETDAAHMDELATDEAKEAEDRVPTSSTEERVPTSSTESSDSAHKNMVELNPMAEIRRHLDSSTPVATDARNHSRLSPAPSSACRPNQSENITAGQLKTPVSVLRQKWGQSSQTPLSSSTPLGLTKGGGETPGTFLQPGFRQKLNMGAFLDTSSESPNLNKSTPLGEVFRRHISRATEKISAQQSDAVDMPASQSASQSQEPEELPPLHGVVIAVAKKLGRSHEKYNQMVAELGGDYMWHIGPQVTHFVFQGRPNDPNKEFRKARDEGKIIVSPHWLTACKEQNCRVDESFFPQNYNPNCSLALTPATRATPRSTRATKSNDLESQSAGSVFTTPSAKVTPSAKTTRKMPVLNLKNVVEPVSPKAMRPAAASVSTDMQETNTLDAPKPKSPARVEALPPDVSVSTPVGLDSMGGNPESDLSEVTSADRSKNQEMKEALTKTLGTVLAEASRSKRTNRRKGKRMNMSGQMSTPDASAEETSWTSKSRESKSVALPEPSQSLNMVTWDDPTERLEKEKLAHKLVSVCEPSQSTDEMLVAMEVPSDMDKHQGKDAKSSGKTRFDDRSPTPEPPPLAFPIAKPSSRVHSPQPVELLSEESSDSRHDNNPKTVPVFLISGMTNEERVDYSALVEQLGGRMVESQHFDTSATHLVVGQPARNEKYLSCIASGKWVLHKSYFEACRKEGKFVQEEQHEWGGDYTAPLAQNMTALANKLADAAHKWRKKVAASRKGNTTCRGAFDGWEVLLCMPKNKEDNFRRLLQAGGADVTSIRSPFPADVDGTHAFVDLNKVPIAQEDMEKLIGADIHCLKAEYIPAFLTDEPPPDPSEFYPTEIISLRASMPELISSRKRSKRGEELDMSSTKRPRRL